MCNHILVVKGGSGTEGPCFRVGEPRGTVVWKKGIEAVFRKLLLPRLDINLSPDLLGLGLLQSPCDRVILLIKCCDCFHGTVL